MNIKDQINEYVNIYIKSIKKEELNKAFSGLFNIQKNPYIDNENLNNAKIFSLCVFAKYKLICFRDEFFNEEAYLKFKNDLENMLNIAKELCFDIAIDILNNSIELLTFLYELFKEYNYYYGLLFDTNDNVILSNLEDGNKIIDYANQKIEIINKKNDFNPFPSVKFLDLKEISLNIFNNLLNDAKNESSNLVYKDLNKIFKENLIILDDEIANKYEYFPKLSHNNSNHSCEVLYSPFEIEAKLAVYYFGLINNLNFVVLNLSNLKIDNYSALFNSINEFKYNLLVLNSNILSGEKRKEFFTELFKFSSNHFVYIHNDSGNILFYHDLINLAQELDIIKIYEITKNYITFPTLNDSLDILKEKGLINNDIDIKDSFKFICFSDLNNIVNKYKNDNWIAIASKLSFDNYKKIEEYLDNIPSQIQLIDVQFGDVKAGTKFKKTKPAEFDYDALRSVDKDNVKKILNSDLRLNQKIGVLVKYILLAGEDISTYNLISDEELKERVKLATTLIYVIYGIDYLPEVIVDNEQNGDLWGGLNVNGGKIIKYKLPCIKGNYNYSIHVICHETRHTFQSFLVNNYSNMFKNIYGISKNMIAQWKKNNDNYINLSTKSGLKRNAYEVQVVEADANAFADDCVDGSNEAYGLIDFN